MLLLRGLFCSMWYLFSWSFFIDSFVDSIDPIDTFIHGTSQGLWLKGPSLVIGSSFPEKRSLAEMTKRCHSLSLVVRLIVTSCTTRCTTRFHSLWIVFIRCHLLHHSLSLAFTQCMTRLSFFINDRSSSFYVKPLFCSLQLSRCLTILIRTVLIRKSSKKDLLWYPIFRKIRNTKNCWNKAQPFTYISKNLQRGITLKSTSLTARLYGCFWHECC